MHEYAFDVKLFAAVRVRAVDEGTARALIKAHLQAVEPSPIPELTKHGISLNEVSADDGEDELYEVDGVEVY